MNYIHETLRPYQKQALDQIIQSDKQFIIVEAPTGAGKSFFPAQLAAWNKRVIALTRTKSLQEQYARNYNFTVLKGKGNYECLGFEEIGDEVKSAEEIYHGMADEMTADLCFVDFKSPCYEHCQIGCPYPAAKHSWLLSDAASLNYTKYLLDKNLVEQYEPDYLFLDEAHELSDLVCDYAGLTIPWQSKFYREYCEPITIQTPQPIAYKDGLIYLQGVLENLEGNPKLHPSKGGRKIDYLRWDRSVTRIKNTISQMRLMPECWFIKSDNKSLVVKPLTARFHFQDYFDKASKVVMMTATVGKQVEVFCAELGIEDYELIKIPNLWPAEERSIDLLDCPRLSYKSSEQDRKLHANAIRDYIQAQPRHWSGLVHAPSIKLAKDLYYRTRLGRRSYLPEPGQGTEMAANNWQNYYQGTRNDAIFFGWNLWEGYDGGDHEICIVAKTPFIDFSSPYDKARFEYDKKAALTRVANKLVQGLGRTRRGREGDYGRDNGVTAIADKNWTRVKNYIGDDIMEAIG